MKMIIYIIIALVILFIGYSISVTPSYDTLDITHAIEKARSELKENQEIVVFDSKNPFNFYDIFNRIEEISYQNKWISRKKILESIDFYGKSEYSQYLKRII